MSFLLALLLVRAASAAPCEYTSSSSCVADKSCYWACEDCDNVRLLGSCHAFQCGEGCWHSFKDYGARTVLCDRAGAPHDSLYCCHDRNVLDDSFVPPCEQCSMYTDFGASDTLKYDKCKNLKGCTALWSASTTEEGKFNVQCIADKMSLACDTTKATMDAQKNMRAACHGDEQCLTEVSAPDTCFRCLKHGEMCSGVARSLVSLWSLLCVCLALLSAW